MRLITLSTSAPPVTLADVKAHLRVDGDALDAVLSPLIEAATDFVERETRQTLRPTTFRLYVDGFPDERELTLPRLPLASVESVRYVADGTERTLHPIAYTVDPSGSKPGRLSLNYDQNWPVADPVANSVIVSFTAGYSGDCPATLKTLIAMVAGHYLEHPEAAVDRRIDAVPLAVESIVNLHAFPGVV
jgi:uncharacterized phiE125 gp8 family phage protein